MEQIEKTENKIVFKTKLSESLANAIRRYVNQVPTLAFDEVEIYKNDSPLYDETVAHRIGLIPLKTENGHNSKTEIEVLLRSDKKGYVYSEEIKGDVEVVYDKIPITFLDEGQEVEIKAIAKLGIGQTHSKYSPGLIFYRNVAEIEMDKEFKEEIKKVYPLVKINDKGNKIKVIDENLKELVDFCSGLAESVGKEVEVNYSDELIFSVESFGQMDTKDILKKAVNILREDLEEIGKRVEKELK